MPHFGEAAAVAFVCADLNACGLGDIGDVNIVGLLNGMGIYWNAVAGEWQVSAPPAGAAIESATYVVAASDSQDPTRADYQCSGANDEVEINTAIAALPAAGGVVHLLEGTYNIAASISIQRSNVMLVGDGWGTEIHVSTDIHGIHVGNGTTALTNIKIGDLRVNGTDMTAAVNVKGIYVHGGSGFEIDRVEIVNTCVHNYNEVGIRCDYTRYSIIRGNVGYSNVEEHILLFDGCGGTLVTSNTSSGDGIGISCFGTDNKNNLIHGNIIINAASAAFAAIYLTSPGNSNSVCDNITIGFSTAGIVVKQDRTLVADNYIYNPGYYGIQLYDASYCTITGNHIYAAAAGADGISVESTSLNNMINGNYLDGYGAYGIDIAAGCNYNRVLNNYYRLNGTGAIRDLGTGTILPEIHVNSIFDESDAEVTLANIGSHVALSMSATVDSTLRFNFKVPSDFQELVRARLVIVPAASGNLRGSVAVDFGACDELYNVNSDSIAETTVAGLTVDVLECINLDEAFTAIAAGDHVGVAFTRAASHAEDTIEDVVYVLEFWMQYV